MRVPCCLVTRCRRVVLKIPFINLEIIGLLPIVTSLCGRTIAEIALLAVFRVEYPSPFSWRLTKKSSTVAIGESYGLFSLPWQNSSHFSMYGWYCFWVPEVQDWMMISVAWLEMPLCSNVRLRVCRLLAAACSSRGEVHCCETVRRVLEHGRIRGLSVGR